MLQRLPLYTYIFQKRRELKKHFSQKFKENPNSWKKEEKDLIFLLLGNSTLFAPLINHLMSPLRFCEHKNWKKLINNCLGCIHRGGGWVRDTTRWRRHHMNLRACILWRNLHEKKLKTLLLTTFFHLKRLRKLFKSLAARSSEIRASLPSDFFWLCLMLWWQRPLIPFVIFFTKYRNLRPV